MIDLKEILIPTVNAQSADTFAQPTFGPVEGGSGGTSAGSIFVSTNKTDIDIGETFEVTVSVNSNNIPVNAIQIVVDFNPALLTVLDSNNTAQGTQVTIVDQVFDTVDPAVDNIVTEDGQIRVVLTTPSAVTVDGDIIRFTMQSQSSGSATIVVNESSDGSVLQQSDGSDLAYTSNQNTIDISTTIFGEGEEPVDPPPVSVPVSNTVSGPGLPDTALPNDISEFAPLLAGLLLVAVGLSLIKGQKSKDSGHGYP